jgi:2,4-dienoyl-CoA reductase-like NADH-dependent reductase (Old Yellow Enzyme family)
MSRSIFDETTLAGIHLKNRLFRSATWVALTKPDGTLTDELFEIYRELAAGGVGTIITELTDVSQHDTAIGTNMRLYSDQLIPQYKRLVEIIHRYGANAIPQLNMNRYIRAEEPHEPVEVDDMTLEDIKAIEKLYIEAAERAVLCGFDAVQLHLAYGWLLYRFLDPASNHRTDAYGGSIKGRACIVSEIIKGIKEKHPTLPVCAKFSFYTDGYAYATDECAETCRLLYESGLDFVEVLGIHSNLERGRKYESCYLELARAVKNRCEIPIILTGTNTNIDTMESILNDDNIPYFALSRPLIREPGLPNRWQSGDREKAHCLCCDGCYRTHGKRCRFAVAERRNRI